MNNYGLSDFQIREIVKNYEEKCNKEDILENSGITEEERDNDDFVERVNQIYTELRNSAPDWNMYLSDAIDQVRKEDSVRGENLAMLYKKVFDLEKSASLIVNELSKVIPLISPNDDVSLSFVSNVEVKKILKILEYELHKKDDFLGEDFFIFAPNRVEAYKKIKEVKVGLDDCNNPYINMSYDEFCKELEKDYGKSGYLMLSKMHEDKYGFIWYNRDYAWAC